MPSEPHAGQFSWPVSSGSRTNALFIGGSCHRSEGGRPCTAERSSVGLPWILYLRFPAGAILARPKLRRGWIVFEAARLGIDLQRLSGAVGDVAQMAQQRAFVPFFDFTVQAGCGANGVQ